MHMSQTFDRSTHQPFRLDNRGLNKEFTMKDMMTVDTV